MNPKIIDDLAKRIAEAMPQAVTDLQHDVEKNVHAVLQSTFSKLNLVTREEFEVQKKVLTKSRAQITVLENRIEELETKLQPKGRQ